MMSIKINVTCDGYYRFLLFEWESEGYTSAKTPIGYDSFLEAMRAARKTKFDFAEVLDCKTCNWYEYAPDFLYKLQKKNRESH